MWAFKQAVVTFSGEKKINTQKLALNAAFPQYTLGA
jgi:hypothetical protein